MIRGIEASGSGMVAQSQKLNVISNNIANVETSGYKNDNVSLQSFQDQLLYNMNTGAQIGALSPGVQAVNTAANMQEGQLQQTGLSTDLAVLSDGFFAVRGTNGTVEYTRNGSFTIDGGGYLATSSGARVLGENGAIRVGGDNFSVASDGTVSSGNKTVGKIALFRSSAANGAVKNADGLFSLAIPVRANGTVKQGWLEGSNVDVIDDMAGLMSCNRSYQSCQQAFQASNQEEQTLVNQVGSLK